MTDGNDGPTALSRDVVVTVGKDLEPSTMVALEVSIN